MQFRLPHHSRGRSSVTILLLLLLIGVLVAVLPRAWEKMLDYAALAEMKQVAIYSGRALQSYWAKDTPGNREDLTFSAMRDLIDNGPLELNPKVGFANESFSPEGYLQLRHERFGERSFFFDYEGRQVRSDQ